MTYSCGPLHIKEQRQDDQQEPIYDSSVSIQGVALKTCRKHWTTENCGEKGSGISMLMARYDVDDEGFLAAPETLTIYLVPIELVS